MRKTRALILSILLIQLSCNKHDNKEYLNKLDDPESNFDIAFGGLAQNGTESKISLSSDCVYEQQSEKNKSLPPEKQEYDIYACWLQ